MLAELKPYPKYKDSGQPWLGRVPSHWLVVPPKRCLRSRSTGGAPIKNTASLERRDGWFPAFSASGQDVWLPTAMFEFDGLVLSAVGARCGKTFRANGKWSVVANTHPLQPLVEQNAEFWWYVTNLPDWWERAGAAQPFVQVANTLRRPWIVPAPAEQAGIVRFLGAVDRKVNRFIRAKRRLIEVLTEQKQAIITHAVTRGLNPHAPLKPSGIDWLGDVPKHWEVARAGSVVQFISTKAHEQFVEDDGEHICVTARFVSTDGRSFRRCTQNFSPAQRSDVLMVMSDLPRGRALARAYFVNDDKSYAVNQRVCILRPKRMNPRFLTFAANRHPELLAHDDGFNQTHLPNSAFKIMRLALPPLAEQEQIVASLVRITSAIDGTLDRTEREIDLIREYRTRLVADVVTGKVDVRAAAAAIPDEASPGDADAPIDDADLTADNDALGSGDDDTETAPGTGTGEEADA